MSFQEQKIPANIWSPVTNCRINGKAQKWQLKAEACIIARKYTIVNGFPIG
jgi:hypothetical protein